MERSVRRDMAGLAALTLALLAPFLGKAFHIDDPLVLWAAKQITQHPLDFYGFDVNWYGYTAPMAEVNQNPPGAAYYAAVFSALFGPSEIAMHASVALLAVALICGVYLLARQLGAAPMIAALSALASPGIFVSATTVMTDLPMTTCYVWAISLWIRGLEAKSPACNVLSALLIAAGALTKYYAITLLPLLLVLTLASGRQRWPRAVALLLPLLLLGGYEWATRQLYGAGHFLDSFGYAKEYQARHGIDYARKALTGLAFLGAGGAPALFLWPWLWRGAERIAVGGALCLCVAGACVLWRLGWQPGAAAHTLPWWFWAQYALWLAAGAHVVLIVAADAWRHRDRWALLFVLWLGGTLVFAVLLYHFVNMRVLLPALPVIALVCARRLQERERPPVTRIALGGALAAALALALCVAWADLRLANAGRAAAARVVPGQAAAPVWFSGHWGFQYYMQLRGAQPIDQEAVAFGPGHTIVTPENASNRLEVRPTGAHTKADFSLPACAWLSTMHPELGAGFYADVWGPLPFVFGPAPEERYDVLVLGH